MRRIWNVAVVVACVVSAGASLAAPAAAAPKPAAVPETSVSYTSQAGDFIGGGQSASYTPANSTITVSGTSAQIRFLVRIGTDIVDAEVAAGVGDTLHPGKFVGAERYPFQTGRNPGVSFTGHGRGCNHAYGNFVVNQVAFGPGGQVTLADITLVQHCESAKAPALTATLRYNALPLSYRQSSQAGDWVGGGVTKTYLNGTSVLRASVTVGSVTGEMQFGVSGLGDYWTGLFSPPSTGSFVLGKTYPTVGRTPDATHAGLDVFGNGRGCNTSVGTLRVDHLTVSGSSITSLRLTFTQACDAGGPLLRGTFRYFA